jgi:sulfatase modifying factor 1
MRKSVQLLYLVVMAIAILTGCSRGDNGELYGVPNRPIWSHPQPYGMVYVPTGTFHFGQSDQEVGSHQIHRNKQVSVVAFYMDDTEISNNEYREFVYYVSDSILRSALPEDTYKSLIGEGSDDEYYVINYKQRLEEESDEFKEANQNMQYAKGERFRHRRQLDVRKLIYSYEIFDFQAAARSPKVQSTENLKTAHSNEDHSHFIKKMNVEVYPDTLVFVRDFAYSYNEPMAENYFWHPNYDDYPVVGVNWNQANAFSWWRTLHMNNWAVEVGDLERTQFRLPTEHEWEYAARGGRDENMYPWGGPYIRNTKGCYLANFKPGRGDYRADGGFYPVKVSSYFPNDYGLYNMAGNVSEWTSSAYLESNVAVVDDMNPDYKYEAKDDEPETLKRKVIRGGSWKDVGYYIQCGSRLYEYQDTCKSFLGFRNVQSYMGRSNKDKK